MLKSFKELKVWKKSYDLCLKAYGSTCELETQILLAGDLGFIDTGNLGETLGSVKKVERMLKAPIRTLE